MQLGSFLEGLFFVPRRNHQLLANLICLTAGAAPNRYGAPLGAGAWLACGSVAAFGLTSVPSLILLLSYALKTPTRKTTYRAILVAILAGAAAIRGAVVLAHGFIADRAMISSSRPVIPVVLQTESAAFMPARALAAPGARIVAHGQDDVSIAAQVAMRGPRMLAKALAASRLPLSRIEPIIVPGAMVFVSAFDELEALAGC